MVTDNNSRRAHHRQPDQEEDQTSPFANNLRRCENSDPDQELNGDMLCEKYQLARVQIDVREEM